MPPNTLSLPDGTLERSLFLGHSSPVYTCSHGLSLDGSCGVRNSSLGTGSHGYGLAQERCLRLPVVGQTGVAEHFDMTADDSELKNLVDGFGAVDGALTPLPHV